MVKKLSYAASRPPGVRLFRWSIIALAGVAGGMVLGEMTASTRLVKGNGEPASYSHLSANPEASVPHGEGAAPCPDCADSYGVATRLRADRESRMGDEFRELGAVDVDQPTEADTDDDNYRYGGRFPDADPVTPTTGENSPTNIPAEAASPTEKAIPAPAGY